MPALHHPALMRGTVIWVFCSQLNLIRQSYHFRIKSQISISLGRLWGKGTRAQYCPLLLPKSGLHLPCEVQIRAEGNTGVGRIKGETRKGEHGRQTVLQDSDCCFYPYWLILASHSPEGSTVVSATGRAIADQEPDQLTVGPQRPGLVSASGQMCTTSPPPQQRPCCLLHM